MSLKKILNLLFLVTLSLFVLSACSDESGDESGNDNNGGSSRSISIGNSDSSKSANGLTNYNNAIVTGDETSLDDEANTDGEDNDTSDNATMLQEIENKLIYAANYTAYIVAKYCEWDYSYCDRDDLHGFTVTTTGLLSYAVSQAEEDIENFNSGTEGTEFSSIYLFLFDNAQKLYIEAQNLLVDYILEYVNKNSSVSKLSYTAITETTGNILTDRLNAASSLKSIASTTRTTAKSTNDADVYTVAGYAYNVAKETYDAIYWRGDAIASSTAEAISNAELANKYYQDTATEDDSTEDEGSDTEDEGTETESEGSDTEDEGTETESESDTDSDTETETDTEDISEECYQYKIASAFYDAAQKLANAASTFSVNGTIDSESLQGATEDYEKAYELVKGYVEEYELTEKNTALSYKYATCSSLTNCLAKIKAGFESVENATPSTTKEAETYAYGLVDIANPMYLYLFAQVVEPSSKHVAYPTHTSLTTYDSTVDPYVVSMKYSQVIAEQLRLSYTMPISSTIYYGNIQGYLDRAFSYLPKANSCGSNK